MYGAHGVVHSTIGKISKFVNINQFRQALLLASIQARNYICKLWPDAFAAAACAAKIIEFTSQRKCKLHSIDAHNNDYMDLLPRWERDREGKGKRDRGEMIEGMRNTKWAAEAPQLTYITSFLLFPICWRGLRTTVFVIVIIATANIRTRVDMRDDDKIRLKINNCFLFAFNYNNTLQVHTIWP